MAARDQRTKAELLEELPDPLETWQHRSGRLTPPDGFRPVWRKCNPYGGRGSWRVLLAGPKRCRFDSTSKTSARCPNEAVAELNRSSSDRPRWWAYCAEHLYGRVFVPPEIYELVLEEVLTDG